jgi:predicted  nucleic acid-binding Zn-ribbon protein
MIRRTVFSLAGLTLLSLFFFGRDALSYVHTSAGMVKDSVKNAVPLTFEIDRARKMVKNLVPDIRTNMHVIAQEEVEVERLENQIAASSANLDKDRGELVKLKNDAACNLTAYEYGGRSYSLSQVKIDLANRFERFKTGEATLASLKDIQLARKKSLESARQKLEGMLAAKRQLEVEVENLDARLKMIEVAQTTSNYNFDDSQLGRAKELVTDLRTRLNVAERMLTVEGDLHDEIPVSAQASENIVDQVTEYLAPAGGAQVAER